MATNNVEPMFTVERCPQRQGEWHDGRCACGQPIGHDDQPMTDEQISLSTASMEAEIVHGAPPSHDLKRRMDNIKAGKTLCRICNGTGNRLYRAYQRCARCQGSGIAPAPVKRFFHVDDGGDDWTIVARDVEHAKQILRDHGIHFTKEDGYSAPIDHPEFANLEWQEMSAAWVARTKVYLDDGRNLIQLADAQIGDFFSSEY